MTNSNSLVPVPKQPGNIAPVAGNHQSAGKPTSLTSALNACKVSTAKPSANVSVARQASPRAAPATNLPIRAQASVPVVRQAGASIVPAASHSNSVPAVSRKSSRQSVQRAAPQQAATNVTIVTSSSNLPIQKRASSKTSLAPQKKSSKKVARQSMPETATAPETMEGYGILQHDVFVNADDLKRLFGLATGTLKALCKQSREQPSPNVLENFPLPFEGIGDQDHWSLTAVFHWNLFMEQFGA